MPDETAPDQIPPGFKLRYTLQGHKDSISRIAWSPDGRTLAAGSDDRTIRLWETTTGHLRTTLNVLYGGSRIAWSPNGLLLATGSANTIHLWNVETSELLYTIKFPLGILQDIAWSPDGRRLAS